MGDAAGHDASIGGVFLIFMLICLACALYVWRVLPETKDKTLEEISASWQKHRAPAQE
jgi:MFS transporter, SP family, xylose:H+ symportor